MQRTAKSNQIRGLVAEYGTGGATEPTEVARGARGVARGRGERIDRPIPGVARRRVGDLVELDRRVKELDDEIGALAKSHPVAQRLQQLRGVGPITATALVATLGSGEQFTKGRDFSVSLGLTPKQHSTGGKERLLGISKRGDPYLRKLLVHGARAVIYAAKDKDDRLSQWVMRPGESPAHERGNGGAGEQDRANGLVDDSKRYGLRAGAGGQPAWVNDKTQPFDRRSLQQRLQSILSDGEQVGPAPAKPENGQVQQSTAKQLGAGARIAHQGPVPQGTIQRPDTREQSNSSSPTNRVLANEEESIHSRSPMVGN